MGGALAPGLDAAPAPLPRRGQRWQSPSGSQPTTCLEAAELRRAAHHLTRAQFASASRRTRPHRSLPGEREALARIVREPQCSECPCRPPPQMAAGGQHRQIPAPDDSSGATCAARRRPLLACQPRSTANQGQRSNGRSPHRTGPARRRGGARALHPGGEVAVHTSLGASMGGDQAGWPTPDPSRPETQSAAHSREEPARDAPGRRLAARPGAPSTRSTFRPRAHRAGESEGTAPQREGRGGDPRDPRSALRARFARCRSQARGPRSEPAF